MNRIQEYYKNPRISASYLKAIINGPDSIAKYNSEKGSGNKKKDVYKRKGSVVDSLITTPTLFNEEYAIIDISLPSDAIMTMVEDIFKYYLSLTQGVVLKSLYEISDESILNHLDNNSYQTNWKSQTRIDKFREAGNEYYLFLAKHSNKVLITKEEFQECTAMQMQMELHDYVIAFEKLKQVKGILVFNQVAIQWHYKEFNRDCKSLLDRIIYNTTDNNIDINEHLVLPAKSAMIIDYKTLSRRTEDSIFAFRDYMYYLSMSFYQEALRFKHSDPSFKFHGYKIINPVLIFGSFACNYPGWFQFTFQDLEIGKYGASYITNEFGEKRLSPCIYEENAELSPNRKKYKGFNDAFKMLEYYETNGTFEVEYQLFQNQGKLGKMF